MVKLIFFNLQSKLKISSSNGTVFCVSIFLYLDANTQSVLHKSSNFTATIHRKPILKYLPRVFFFIIRAWTICPRCTAAYRLIVQPLSPRDFRHFHFRCQAPPRPYDARDPSSERWNCGRECWPVILPKCQLPCYI